MIQRDWLTPATVARMLGVTPCRVRQLVEQGKLACEWTPLGRLIDPQSVEKLAREREARRKGAKVA